MYRNINCECTLFIAATGQFPSAAPQKPYKIHDVGEWKQAIIVDPLVQVVRGCGVRRQLFVCMCVCVRVCKKSICLSSLIVRARNTHTHTKSPSDLCTFHMNDDWCTARAEKRHILRRSSRRTLTDRCCSSIATHIGGGSHKWCFYLAILISCRQHCNPYSIVQVQCGNSVAYFFF